MKRLTATPFQRVLRGPKSSALQDALRCIAVALGITASSASLAGPVNEQSYWSSNGNFLLGNHCQNLIGLTVSLHVTQNMVATVTAGDGTGATSNGGFALQLNATPPQGPSHPLFWLQYGIIVHDNEAAAFVQYWDNAGVDNHGQPTILELPSNMIPAGWVLTIKLANDRVTGDVTGITFSVTDSAGHTTTKPMLMPTYPKQNNKTVLAPIKVMLVNVVGPINWEKSAFISGAGYITYEVSDGQLGLTPSDACGVRVTGELSNAAYGMVSPSVGPVLIQPLTTPFAGALASSTDTANHIARVYHFTQSPPVGKNQNIGNFHLDQLTFDGTWSSKNVTATARAPAATLGSPLVSFDSTLDHAPEAFYLVPNSQGGQQVEQLSGKTWGPSSLTTLANAHPAAMGSGLTGYVDPLAGTENVAYQGMDQHVHLLVRSSDGKWAEDTRLPHTQAATFASALTSHMNDRSQEIFYIGKNRHIYELWRWSKGFNGWRSTDLTLANGAKSLPAVGSPLVGLYDTKAGNDAVFYVSTDQHIHELLSSKGKWTGVDVTLASHAPPPGLGSALAAHLNAITGSEEVFFVTSDHIIEEIWSQSKGPGWTASNLFRGAVGSPTLASPGSPLTTDINSLSGTKTDEVYYVGVDGNVHELSWSPKNPRWSASVPSLSGTADKRPSAR